MKYLFLLVISIYAPSVKASLGSFVWGVNVSGNLNFSIGKNPDMKFWAFPNDTNGNIVSSQMTRKILPGFSIQPLFQFIKASKNKKINFLFEFRTGYMFRQYGLSWSGYYANGNAYDVILPSIKRHDFLFSPLVGFKYKNFILKTGVACLLAIPVENRIKYSVNGSLFTERPFSAKAGVRKYVSLTFPISISYFFDINTSYAIGPQIDYSLGLYDYDIIAVGSVPRGIIYRSDYISIGIIFLFKKNKA